MADKPERLVWIVNIDIKDGWYDTIHAFTSKEQAQAYVDWQQERGGDHCYITAVPLQDTWVPPEPAVQTAVWSF
jgi:hypothetical protein